MDDSFDTKIDALTNCKDVNKAYSVLIELEKTSEVSNILYPYINVFMDMVQSKNYYVKVRGFRLFCMQSRWDDNRFIDKNINFVLDILNEERPTIIRQALEYLREIAIYKGELKEKLLEKVENLDTTKFKDTMKDLIKKDIIKLKGYLFIS